MGALIKHDFTFTLYDSGEVNSLTGLYNPDDIGLAGLITDLRETLEIISNQHYVTTRKGNRVNPSFALGVFLARLRDAAGDGTAMDFLFGLPPFDSMTSTRTNSDVFHFDVEFDIAGTPIGGAAETLRLNQCYMQASTLNIAAPAVHQIPIVCTGSVLLNGTSILSA